MIRALVFVTVLFGSTPILCSEYREDLTEWISNELCKKQSNDLTKQFKLGVYDASIIAKKITLQRAGVLSPKKLQIKAKELAQTKNYNGYSYALCTKYSAIIVATPSLKGLSKTKNKIHIPIDELNESCTSWKILIAYPKAKSFVLEPTPIIETPPKKQGMTSITCKPKSLQHLGSRLWFLAPLGKLEKAPNLNLLKDSSDILTWINQLRIINGLIALKKIKLSSIDPKATLTKSSNLDHFKKHIKEHAKAARRKGLIFIGENKVIAKSLHYKATLLYLSPGHRDLLLKKADFIAISEITKNMIHIAIYKKSKKLGKIADMRKDNSKVNMR